MICHFQKRVALLVSGPIFPLLLNAHADSSASYYIGYTKANLSAVTDNKPHDHWFKLRPVDKSAPTNALAGEILLTLQFCTTTVCISFDISIYHIDFGSSS